MTEPETIEAEVTEQMGQAMEVAAPAPVNLFRTDDPSEVVRRATATATVLKQVLVDQDLISNISGKEHVKAEGWTLLGTMLGVFPVLEWSRRTADPEGWEARVEAKTLSGATVGAGEAMCTRAEKEWGPNPTRGKMRDDFALRSMAQTRATSKALKQPLGFIVKMAGFEATPAEEMTDEGEERRQEGARQDAPPRSWQGKDGIRERLEKGCDGPKDVWNLFLAFARAASVHLWGVEKPETAERKSIHLQKAATVCVWLMEEVKPVVGDLILFDEDTMRRGWAQVVDGHALEIPDYVAPEPEASETSDVDEEAERAADAAITGPSS